MESGALAGRRGNAVERMAFAARAGFACLSRVKSAGAPAPNCFGKGAPRSGPRVSRILRLDTRVAPRRPGRRRRLTVSQWREIQCADGNQEPYKPCETETERRERVYAYSVVNMIA